MMNVDPENSILSEISSILTESKFFPEIKIPPLWPTYSNTGVESELRSVFRMMDSKSLKISDQEIEEEIQKYRKSKRKN